ncbi:MAG: Gfo/Idh/MocA family oxidoreductase [Armatimonadetes bacterium]|nr:Gfo/Idh/MocA family oxidoreductase [Armatimonadota bacterium]NIO75512.1 Gfo/Idh/MocA family oxidoreductase [Armatimonadota bacterium]NIO95889.1 Gfo/Idh/MocA family oxidoreductase [Armatimonadota bacterium]
MAKRVNIGMVGYKFMGRTHSNAYRQVCRFFDCPVEPVMKAVCGRNRAGVTQAAEQLGWESVETNWRKLVARPDIDVIDISTGNNTHAPIAIAAAKAGKHIFCEKPLAMNVAEAKKMVAAVEKAGVKHMINFNYRGVPAVVLAKQMIAEGRLGQIYHWRGTYLQDWIVDPEFPLVWRLEKRLAGAGALGDIGAHSIDLARYLVGEITEVVADMKTFIEKRPKLADAAGGLAAAKRSKAKGRVTVDDAAIFLTRFDNGAMGTFEASRFAPGRRNYNTFEISGSKGSLRFCFEQMNELEYFDNTAPAEVQGFTKILVTDGTVHPYFGAWWPGGHIIGYEHTFVHMVYEFLKALRGRKNPKPDFYDGLRNQIVLEAVEKSAKSRRWVKISIG